jgi:predicted RNA-binding protein Jag
VRPVWFVECFLYVCYKDYSNKEISLTEAPEEQEPTDEDKSKEKQLKKDLRDKLKEVLKALDLDETFTVSLRTKQQKDYILDYPDRTICGCDGEVYNILMNWAYAQQIPNHLAFDRFVETFGIDLDKIKQRPEAADRASRRYYKSQRKDPKRPDPQLSLFSESKS